MEFKDYLCYKPEGEIHPADLDYFKQYHAPLFEAICKQTIPQINHTTPYYGPLFYSLVKLLQAANVVEIGVGYGWCSWFMAMAVYENTQRYTDLKTFARYLAIDNSPRTKELFDELKSKGLPVEYIYRNSIEVKTEELLAGGHKIDLIFQDGNHELVHCLKELDIILPALKDNGNGYLICHDTYAWCEEYRKAVAEKIKKGELDFEELSFMPNMGITIYRNMKNFDRNKVVWPLTKEMRENPVW